MHENFIKFFKRCHRVQKFDITFNSGLQAALMIGLFWLFAKIGLLGCTEVYLSKLLNVFVANCKMYFLLITWGLIVCGGLLVVQFWRGSRRQTCGGESWNLAKLTSFQSNQCSAKDPRCPLWQSKEEVFASSFNLIAVEPFFKSKFVNNKEWAEMCCENFRIHV